MYEFPHMPHPTESFEPGSFDWVVGQSMRLYFGVDSFDSYGAEEIVKPLEELMTHGDKFPWEVMPTPEKPYNSVDKYFMEICGKNWDTIKGMIAGYTSPELIRTLDSHRSPDSAGGDRKSAEYKIISNNITNDIETPDRGTSHSYTLNRLRRKRPDLFNRVVNDELSANAAAIEAGFRIKTITVPLDIDKAVRTLAKHFTLEEIQKAW